MVSSGCCGVGSDLYDPWNYIYLIGITARTSPNLIDLGIAIVVSVAGSFSMTRERLSNPISGVAIAVALVTPLCVSGIGLTMSSDVIAVFRRGTVAGLSNQTTEGSFLLFLANLTGIIVASLFVSCLSSVVL